MNAEVFLPAQNINAPNDNFERFLIYVLGAANVVKHLLPGSSLTSWEEGVEAPPGAPSSSLGNDIYNLASLPINYLREKYDEWRYGKYPHEERIENVGDLYYD